MEVLRKYGVATTVLMPLVDAGAIDFESTPVTFVAADTQISKDEGAFANTGSTPVHEGKGIYSLALTATEMQAARISIVCIDAATKLWEDQAIIIATYGHASAQHAFDLDLAEQTVALSAQGKLDVNAEADGALTDYDAATGAEVAAVQADTDNIQTRLPAALVSGRMDASVGAMAAGVITAAAIAADALTSAKIDASFGQEIADEILKRGLSNVEPSPGLRTVYGALASLVNRVKINGTNLEIYQTDDLTLVASIPLTTSSSQDPITELDPA